ncbi:MAG: rubrerythrin [Herbinix sp.]|jgi:rubrerythrin|nr:rubrerythrin [Herbinix sp.]
MNNMPYEYDMVMYKTLPEALALVKSAVEGEREDELFYDYLISVAPSQEEVNIIQSIRDDERKHNEMFREIYAYFTGEEIQAEENPEFEKPRSYIEGIKKALFGELAAVERYRNIRAGLPVNYYRDMVFEILTDELKHADKYNYILNLHHMNHEKENDVETMRAGSKDYYNEANQEYYTGEQFMDYIRPLVERGIREEAAGKSIEQLLQKYILAGFMIGMGMTIPQVENQIDNMEDISLVEY